MPFSLIKSNHRCYYQKVQSVYCLSRREKSQSTIDEFDLKDETGQDSGYFLNLDLLDLTPIKTAAEAFRGKETELHMLYKNR